MMYLLTSLIMLIMILVSVGFFTLLERKVLGYIQIRKGPNSVGYSGLLQPFSDGMKLFISEQSWPFNSNYLLYYLCPLYSLVQSLFIWVVLPLFVNSVSFEYGMLMFLCCSSVSVYGLFICGWSSNSVYSLIGAIRGVSQAISYEVSLALMMFCYFLLIDSFSFLDLLVYQSYCFFILISFPVFFCWFSSCLAETNRSPYDFSEGESELVSGFNVEYGGGGFAILFISEYSSIIFMSFLTVLIFFGEGSFSFIFFFKVIFFCFLFIWVRGSFPRYRYDKLMYLAWKCYLPLCLNYIFFFMMLSVISLYHFFLLSC